MKRGQIPLLWVIIELVLVIAASIAIFSLIDRAKDDKGPLENYAARELAFTRSGMDIYARSNAFYQLVIPDISFNYETSFAQGAVKVGSTQASYGYDLHLTERGYQESKPLIVTLETAASAISAGGLLRRENHKQFLSCAPVKINGRIAIIPASIETQALAQIIVAQNPSFLPDKSRVNELLTDAKLLQDTVTAADAVIVLATSQPKSDLAFTNDKGLDLGCNLVNALTLTIPETSPASTDNGAIPLAVDFAPETYKRWIKENKPVVVLNISDLSDIPKTANKLYAKLS